MCSRPFSNGRTTAPPRPPGDPVERIVEVVALTATTGARRRLETLDARGAPRRPLSVDELRPGGADAADGAFGPDAESHPCARQHATDAPGRGRRRGRVRALGVDYEVHVLRSL